VKHRDPDLQEVRPRRGKVHLAEKIGLNERSVEDRQRRLYLFRSERVERTLIRENRGRSTGDSSRSTHSQEKYLYVRRYRAWMVGEDEEAQHTHDS
jgi:hypothetical protein